MQQTDVILIPSYEPEETLIQLVKKLWNYDVEIVVVDDGSGKLFSGIFQEVSNYAHVISYQENRGKGYALKEGLKYIKKTYSNCVIVTMDGDGQHDIGDALRLSDCVQKNRQIFYLGARKMPGDAPIKSRLGNAITRQVFAALTGVRIYDTQTGLRAFSSLWIDILLGIEGDRYEYEMNVLLYIARERLPFEEINVRTIYLDKENSVSHFDAVKDSVRIYKRILKFAMSSFIGFVVDYLMYILLSVILSQVSMGLLIANVGARMVSATVNFTINRKLVFKSKENLTKEIAKYFLLALFIISVNSLILSGFVSLGMNAYVAKILVELIMFVFNYMVQHKLVFRQTEVL